MRRITLAERAAQIERRLAAGACLPPAEALRNPGLRRTKRKRRLLERIETVASRAGGGRPSDDRGETDG